MVTVKSVPEGVQAVFPMLVCRSPEAEMNFCAAAFGAIEEVRRPGSVLGGTDREDSRSMWPCVDRCITH